MCKPDALKFLTVIWKNWNCKSFLKNLWGICFIAVKGKKWQSRPLKDFYIIVYFDTIHFKVRAQPIPVWALILVAGQKDLSGIRIDESGRGQLLVEDDYRIKNRGVKDSLIACIDGLKLFFAITSSFSPNAGAIPQFSALCGL